jgi:hypothetical protein
MMRISDMRAQTNCFICKKQKLTRNEIGLNRKLIDKDVKKFHCLQCLADYLDISVEDLEERIQDFKDSGCTLFD